VVIGNWGQSLTHDDGSGPLTPGRWSPMGELQQGREWTIRRKEGQLEAKAKRGESKGCSEGDGEGGNHESHPAAIIAWHLLEQRARKAAQSAMIDINQWQEEGMGGRQNHWCLGTPVPDPVPGPSLNTKCSAVSGAK
jgi:hypothetical protein